MTTLYYKGTDLLAFAQDLGGHAHAFIGARQPAALHGIDERVRASPHWEFT